MPNHGGEERPSQGDGFRCEITMEDLLEVYRTYNDQDLGIPFAMLNLETGEVHFQYEDAGVTEIPEGAEDSEDWVPMPDRYSLDLGKVQALDFTLAHMPEELERVKEMFRGRGGYRLFKDLLRRRGLLQKWRAFEDACLREALRAWGRRNGIRVIE